MTTTTMSPKLEQQFQSAALAAGRQVLIDNMLAESQGLTKMQVVLEEGKSAGGPLIVEGKVGHAGVPTANKRLYNVKIMQREIDRLQERINQGAVLAAVDHPGDGKSRIREAGAICRGLRMEPDGTIIGRYEIVEASTGGKDLAAFLRAGASIGMSSRGLGSTTIDANGYHVVGEDFRLHGFDFVADPACRDAYPTLVSESADATDVTEDQLRAQFPQLIESIESRARQVGAEVAEAEVEENLRGALLTELREQLREDFAAKLVKALQQQRSQVEEVVRSELLSDPSVAGAKKFMEDLANKLVPYRPAPDLKALIDARDAEIEGLRARLQNMEEAISEVTEQKKSVEAQARSLGFRLFVERALSGQARAEQMRNLIGDPMQYGTVEELQARVKAVIEQVNAAHAEAEERARAAVKVKEHKAELATAKAQMVSEELDRVREELAAKVESVAERFQRQLQERDRLLDQAASHIDRLEQELDKARRLAEQAETIAYAERRAVGHPRRDDLIAAVMSGRATSKEQVRQLAESWEVRGEEVGGAAERIRRSLGKGREAPTEAESHRIDQLTEDRGLIPGLERFGTTMGELKQLAGIGQTNTRRRF